MKNEELGQDKKINLLDNEENLFDLGLYVGLGGTVLSLILLLVLDVNDALIGAYTSTLFGILFVAALRFLWYDHIVIICLFGNRKNSRMNRSLLLVVCDFCC